MISSVAWLPASAVKPIPRAKPLTEEELAEARRLAAQDSAYPHVVGAGAELYEEEDDSEWETDNSDGGNGGMGEDDDDVAKAKAAAKRIQAERVSSYSRSAKGKARSSEPVGTGGLLLRRRPLTTPRRSLEEPPGASLSGLDAAMAELDMDNYDDDDDDESGSGAANTLANPLSLPAGVFSAGTQYYSSNKEDPYLKFGKGPKDKKGKGKGAAAAAAAADDDDSDFASSEDDETDEDDLDDWELRPEQDLLLLAARNEDDVSHLEVWVCEPPGTSTKESSGDTDANVYVHHDVLLAAFPLCLAWFDAAPGGGSLLSSGRRGSNGNNSSTGSFVAVGTMEPGIELWDVDEADAVEPVAVLGPAPFAAEARAAAAEAARVAEAAEDSEDGDGRKSTSRTNNKKKKKGSNKKGGGKKSSSSKSPVAPATPTPLPPLSSPPKRRSRKDAAAGGPHADAVLGLAWNGAFRNVLASASADRTVKVWDLASVGGGAAATTALGTRSGPVTSATPVATFCHHSGKVQAVAFNPADPPVLLTGGFDGTAALVDVRSPAGTASASSSSKTSSSSSSSVPCWKVGADVEALAWDPSNPTDFYVASEDGVVSCFDARSAGSDAKPKFRLSAHSKAATALAFAGAGAGSAAGAGGSSSSTGPSSCVAPGLLATGSTDKKVKLWDVSGGAPELVSTADLKVGAVFGLGFGGLDLSSKGRPPRPLLAAAGAKGTVAVWDVAADEAVARRWRKTLG